MDLLHLDHDLMLKSVEAMLPENWIKVYVQRWLQMKVVKADGSVIDRGGKGTPQGGVISPILANLFLHYGLDKWLEQNYPHVKFIRYADDAVVHCQTEAEAQQLLTAIKQRMHQIGLRLNETKTKIVYCKDYRRRQNHEQVQFGFLGFSFQPRPAQSKFGNGNFTAFVPEISKENQKKIRENIREVINWRNTSQQVEQIAETINSKLRGWLNYFELYGKRQLYKTMFYLETRLLKWMMRKHKHGIRTCLQKLQTLKQQKPTLLYHWERKYSLNYQKMTRAV